MLEKNEEYVGVVESIGSNGEGIVKKEGQVIFVPGALVGEKIRYKILKTEKRFAFAKAYEICAPAEERVRPRCSAFGKCGGCQLQHLVYREQLKIKGKTISDCFAKNAFVSVKPVSVSCGDDKYNYRNKLQIPVAETEKGTKIGFFAVNSHRIVPVDDCPINKEWAGAIISVFKDYIEKYNVKGYSEFARSGLLRHIVVREMDAKFVITVVATDKNLPHVDYLIEELKKVCREMSLYVNVNSADTNVVFGDKFVLLYGPEKMKGTYCGLKFEFGPESFFQVNDSVCKKLYDKVAELAGSDGKRVVIDAYSGAGIMTAMLAKRSKKAIGIECVKEAVDCADRLKELNGLEGVMENINAECEKVLPELIDKLKKAGEEVTLVVDPPRKGLDKSLIDVIKKSGIDTIVYVSCNPATLARDVGLLTETLVTEDNGEIKKNAEYFAECEGKGLLNGTLMPFYNGKECGGTKYESAEETPVYIEATKNGRYALTYVHGYDMFPMTKHVETLVVLSHKKPDSHIEVKIDFDNTSLDKMAISERAEKRKPQEKTTYKKIQEWIEENYGFKVHTAYVAEVKRELGLPMYDAPNAVEELKRPRSHPTEEMTIAIKAALKHFEII